MKEQPTEFKCTEKCEGCVSKTALSMKIYEDSNGSDYEMVDICSLRLSPSVCKGPLNWEQYWKEAGAL